MKEYILTVAAAAVLSAIAAISVPKNWVGYIRLITGAVILCSIISPVMNIIAVRLNLSRKTDTHMKIMMNTHITN